MADTITIRLDIERRQLFDAEAAIRGIGPSTLARELLDERLREIRRLRIYSESAEAANRYHADMEAVGEAEVRDGLDALGWDAMAPYEGTINGRRP